MSTALRTKTRALPAVNFCAIFRFHYQNTHFLFQFSRDFMNFGKRSYGGAMDWNDDQQYVSELPQKKDGFGRDFMNFGKRAEPFDRSFMNFGKKRADTDAFSRDFLSFGKR